MVRINRLYTAAKNLTAPPLWRFGTEPAG